MHSHNNLRNSPYDEENKTITDTTPTIPILDLLADNINTSDNTPLFNWTASTDADNDAIIYEILIDNETSFAPPYTQSNSTLTSNDYTAQTLNDGTYYWKAKAMTPYANSSYTNYRTFKITDIHKFLIKDPSANNVASFGDLGNIVLKGNCTISGTCTPPTNSFIIKNPSNEPIAYIDQNGNLCLESGTCNDQYSNCNSPGDGSFIIRNEADTNVAFINSTGSLCLIGNLIKNGNP